MNGLTSLKTAEDYLQQAEIYQTHWQWEQALFCYQRAKNLQPLSWKALNSMGEVLSNLERWEEAVSIYRQVLKLNSQFDWSYHQLAVALDRLGRFEESDRCYEQLIELSPDFWEINYNDSLVQQQYGQFLFRQEQWEKAESAFQRVVELEPSSYSGYSGLGESLWQQRKWGALAAYCRAEELAPSPAQVLPKLQEITSFFYQQSLLIDLSAQQAYALAEAFTQLEQWDQAVKFYRQAQSLQEHLPQAETQVSSPTGNEMLRFVLSKIQRPEGEKQLVHKSLHYAAVKQSRNLSLQLPTGVNQSTSFVAGITEVALGGILRGWIKNLTDPSQSIDLKVSIDGEQIATVKATHLHRFAHHSQTIDRPKEFEVALPPILKNQLLLDGGIHVLELIPTNQDDNSPIAMQITLPRRGFGRLDGWENGYVKGWALPDGHTGTASLDVYLDDVFFKTIKADSSRLDLLRYGMGDGKNGFAISIPLLTQSSNPKVDVLFSQTKYRLQRSPISLDFPAREIEKYHDRKIKQFALAPKLIANKNKSYGITIIIPIFNAYDAVRDCIQSVIENTSIQARLLLINDASTDERMLRLLQWAGQHSHVTIINNKENLGYTKTINLGIQHADEDDVVLLNSDTLVGPCWLQNLQVAAYHDVDIATVTAMSDNAGAFSVPRMGCANDTPIWLNSTEMARAVTYNSQSLYPEVPTGNGFCLYIRRAVFKEIGLFDEVAFPRGYGEENDFCMRALRAGWRHVIDDRTFVRHVRSASFQGEKKALIAAGRQLVDEQYPEYKSLISVFTQSPELQAVRYNVGQLMTGPNHLKRKVLPRVLYVISTRTGGTPQTNEDLMRGLANRYHTMLLHCDSQEITLYDTSSDPHLVCKKVLLQSPISPTSHRSSEYDAIVSGILVQYGIELLHIRHIAWHSLSLPFIAKQLGIPVIFSFHDFYTICPTVNLLDENQVFCGGHCTATNGQCNVPLWQGGGMPPLKHQFILTWQRMMRELMQAVDAFVTTSDSAKAQLQAIYPCLQNVPFWVIPHGRDFPQLDLGITLPEQFLHPSQPLRILFLGNIGVHKGAKLIVELHELDVEERFEFHFLGATDKCLASVGRHHGKYRRDDFVSLVQKIQPHYVGILSIWPETYCHTLTESWASGIPVIAIDKGSVGERIRQHGGGWLLDSTSPQEIYIELLRLADDTKGYSQKVMEVRRWQQTYGRQNNIAAMAAKYNQLYQQVFAATHSFKADSTVRHLIKVGVFVERDRNNQPTTLAYLRALEWLEHSAVQRRLDLQLLMVDAFLQDEDRVLDIEVVWVQQGAIKPHLVQSFIEICHQRNLPIIFDIDNSFIDVPAEKDPEGFHTKVTSTAERLACAAKTVIVSTEPMAKHMQQVSSNVKLIPNALSEFAWLRPIKPIGDTSIATLEAASNTLKLLYMGKPNTQEMAMLQAVFKRLNDEQYPVTLFVIEEGPEDKQQSSWYHHLALPDQFISYPRFVDWFRTVTSYCDLALIPLIDIAPNHYKNMLKLIQYSAVGLPGICSDCSPYNEIVKHGVTGFLVRNTEVDWYEAIVSSHQDKDILLQLGKAAQDNVMKNHLIANHANVYTDLFEQVADRTEKSRNSIAVTEIVGKAKTVD